jgi:hypothetical protein
VDEYPAVFLNQFFHTWQVANTEPTEIDENIEVDWRIIYATFTGLKAHPFIDECSIKTG